MPDSQAQQPQDPDLAALVNAWPDLPNALRQGIMAMVRTAQGEGAKL